MEPSHGASVLPQASHFTDGSADPPRSDGNEADEGVMFDCNGKPADNSRTGTWLTAYLILGTEFAERLCIIDITLHLQRDLHHEVHLSFAMSQNITAKYLVILNILGFFGGFIGDFKVGRFWAIVISAGTIAMGMILLSVGTTVPSLQPQGQMAMVFMALPMIALGDGGLKGNVPGFLSDQFDKRVPGEARALKLVFNRFYGGISVGSLLAYSALVYVDISFGHGWSYCISTVIMILMLTVLVVGRQKYRYRKPEGNPLVTIFRVCLDKATMVLPAGRRLVAAPTMREVEEVKLLANLLPIWVTSLIFWGIYNRMTLFSREQAILMDHHLGHGFEIPAISFACFLFLSIILFTFINEPLLMPLASRLTHSPHGPTSLQRIGAGMVLATVSMVVAGLIEHVHLHTPNTDSMSAFWLVPQYFLLGAGDAAAFVGQLEFFIRQGPERMKSISTGIFLATMPVGNFFGTFLLFLINRASRGAWITEGAQTKRVDLLYWTLAVLGAANFTLFLALAKRHAYN